MIDTLTTIASFLIALGVLVFVHELGHFMVAKWGGYPRGALSPWAIRPK